MKRSLLWIGVVGMLTGIGLAEPLTEPVKQFSGLIEAKRGVPSESFFVRDAEGWEQLVARIPKKRVQMKQPAPPSSDPLLQECPVDFEHQLAVVSTSNDIYTDSVILAVDGETIRCETRRQPGYGIGAKPDGVGRYHLWVIEKP